MASQYTLGSSSAAVMMPVNSYLNATYFTLRAGGEALATFIYDSVYIWCCMIPVAYVVSRFTNISSIPLYILVQCLDSMKIFIGTYMLKKGRWIRNLTA